MSETKHTPGEWRVRKWSAPMSIEGNIHQIADASDFPTAFVPAWDKPGDGEVDGTEEARANARLIAAAPDMLEALKAATGHLLNAKIDLETGAPKKTAIDTIEGGLRIIRDALAKAGAA